MKYGGILDRVGNTPLIDISVLSPNPQVEIWAKLEGENPTGSGKDRIAKYMINHAESEGLLQPGQTILEPSSGNTGIAISLIGTLRGYPVKVVMPDAVSIERIQLLEAFGAEIIFSPGDLGSNGAVELATNLARKNPEWFMPFRQVQVGCEYRWFWFWQACGHCAWLHSWAGEITVNPRIAVMRRCASAMVTVGVGVHS